jgi:hypothetical protein
MSSESRVVAIVPQSDKPVSVVLLKERAQHVQEVIASMMVEGVHYGVIPGTQNRTLLKEGTELLLSAFQIAIEPRIEESTGPDFVRYTVHVRGTHMGSGGFIGEGIGRCSTNEEKYKWREVVCKEEWDQTPENRRREKWRHGKGGNPYMTRQVRTNPEDLAGTVLKMAKKRAQADLCLTALAASGAFKRQPAPPKDPPPPTKTAPENRSAPAPSPAATPPVDKSARKETRPATAALMGLLKRKLDESGIPETHFLAQFELGRLEEMPFEQVDAALAWIRDLVEPRE